MRIPNADKAIIAPEKLRDYLLNPAHRRGSAKARLLLACGYQADAWQVLEHDLRTQHLTVDFAVTKDNLYGRRFEVARRLQPRAVGVSFSRASGKSTRERTCRG